MDFHIHIAGDATLLLPPATQANSLDLAALPVRTASTETARTAPVAAAAVAPVAGQPPAPGEVWPGQGGIFLCTLPAMFNLPARHLVRSTAEAKQKWGPYEEVAGAGSHFDGAANTAKLLAHGRHDAAAFASSYSADGHADFFLPSKMDLLFAHLYAPQVFEKEGWYWTSTQGSRNYAFVVDFEFGYSDWHGKDYDHRVCAVRVIPVNASPL